MMRAGIVVRIAVGSVVALASAAAAAGDGIRPRTPVVWPDDTPCSLTVDRSVDPVAQLPYTIAAEDPPAGETTTADEVADGRRHQFFAFSTDIDPRIAMPEWITDADVLAAAALDLAEPDTIEPDAVLESHSVLADTFVRIDADDARRPITFAVADAGVDWDTSELATGAWVVRAYTWDPWPSLWASPRPGVVAVADDADPGSHAPAHAVHATSEVLYRDDVGSIVGCLVAMDGTEVTAEWTFFDEPDGEWVAFVQDEPVVGDAFELAFAPPEPLWGRFAVIRVTATDPMDRSSIAYVAKRITVLDSDAPPECATEPDACATTSGESAGSSSESAPDATTSAADGESSTDAGAGTSSGPSIDMPEPGGSGCSCAADHRVNAGEQLVLIVVVGLGVRRRRRRSFHPNRAAR
jgi:hypothetical protein